MKNEKNPPKRGNILVKTFKTVMKPKAPEPIKKVVPAAGKPLVKNMQNKPMKRVMLPEVRVTAPRIRKVTEETVKLYPKGEVAKRSVDSLKRMGMGKIIGEPIMKKGEKAMYGTAASDVIKQRLKKK